MPFESEAQRGKFRHLVDEGKISQATFDEWNEATGDKKLLERKLKPVAKPPNTKKKRRR